MPTDIDTITPPSQRLPTTTQATAVEQARAIAEVQAAVVVAQQVPRDMGAAEADMVDACRRIGLAQRAFYSVPRSGGKPVTGPSVHLARELARIFGNVQYGVHELRRDDEQGMSEIQAFAWDVEKNVRSTRTFQVPHQRMKRINGKPTRDPLVDLTDVYLNNQNIGARAVRECIFTVLPAWFTDKAEELCHKTISEGEGKPLSERITNMVRLFGELGIAVEQLEEKIGRRRSAWQPIDIAQMTIVYTSIQRGEITKEDAFPPKMITAAEVMSEEQAVPKTGEPGRTAGADDPAPLKTTEPEATESPASAPSPQAATPVQQPAPEPGPADTKDSGEAADVSTGRATGPRCTVQQQAEIHAALRRLDIDDHDEKLWWVNRLAGLEPNTIDHPKQLRQPEAIKIITALEKITSRDELDASINQDPLLGDD